MHIKARVQKPYPIYDKNGQNQLKSIPYLWPKRLKNHTLWGCTYLYSPYKGVAPLLGYLPCSLLSIQTGFFLSSRGAGWGNCSLSVASRIIKIRWCMYKAGLRFAMWVYDIMTNGALTATMLGLFYWIIFLIAI